MTAPGRSLLRILGVAFGIAAALGGAIGVGILRAPGIVAGQLPHSGWILAAWAAGGVYALLGSLCVIELSTSVPKAGGWYAYTREAFGEFPALFVGWGFWLSLATAISYGAVALEEYFSLLVPGCPLRGRPLALVITAAFCGFQLVGLRPVSRFQEFAGLLKGLVFLALVGACLIWAPSLPASAAGAPATAHVLGMSAIVIALSAIIKTYDGWQAPSWFVEEDRNPTRNLPRSMIAGVLLIIVIYLGVNLALVATLSPAEIAASKLPVASAIEKLFGALSGRVVTAIAIVNIVGLLNTLFLSAPRILFAMARDGLFFRRAAEVSPRGVPVFGTIFSGAAGAVMLAEGGFEWIFVLSTFLSVVCYTAGYAALFKLRWSQPDRPRPFKVWGYPIVPGIILAVSVAFLYGAAVEEPSSVIGAVALLALSYPVYRLIRRKASS